MKNILTHIFTGLGVIFFILILIGSYFFVTDPYNLKPLIFGNNSIQTTSRTTPIPTDTQSTTATGENTSTTVVPSGGFELSEAQKQALVSFGIDPATVPTSISSEQETCFTGVLGRPRVAEIKSGAVPSALEFLKAKACI